MPPPPPSIFTPFKVFVDTWESFLSFINILCCYSREVTSFSPRFSLSGAFLLPYAVMLIIEGIPLLYLELSVGQRLRKGSLKAWGMISPYMGGIGLASLVICILTASYYSVVISWCLFYLFSSFRSSLPWSKCPTVESFNSTSNRSVHNAVSECSRSNSILYFFFRETLNVSENIEETTTWNWKITLCYIAAWIVIYICIIRGIKSSGKVSAILGFRNLFFSKLR